MTAASKDLFLSRLGNETGGRVPIFLRDLTLGLDVTGVRTTDVFGKIYDHVLSSDAVVAFQRLTGQDAVVGCIQSAAFNVESFGGTMKYPEYGIPVPMTHPFENATDVPSEIVFSPMMRGAVLSYSKVREKLPDVAVVCNVEGPLTKTGTLTGMDQLAILLINEKDLASRFIETAMEHTKMFAEELHRNSSMDALFIAAATDNPDLFGCGIYEEFSLKYTQRLIRMSHSLGYPAIFHPHGIFSSEDMNDTFCRTLDLGMDGFQFAEDNDPHVITSRIGSKCAVLGGTDIVPTLLYGSENEIRSRTSYYVNACSSGRYVFMPSCSMHRGADIERIKIMLDAVRETDIKTRYVQNE